MRHALPMRLVYASSSLRSLHSKPACFSLGTIHKRRYDDRSFGRRVVGHEDVSYMPTSPVEGFASSLTRHDAPATSKAANPLSILPLTRLARSYLITSISSFPPLLRTSLWALKRLAHAKSPLLSPDRNPIVHFLLKKTAYAQFCAGEDAAEVGQTIGELKSIGFTGVMLCYAREVSVGGKDAPQLANGTAEAAGDLDQIAMWANGTLDTVKMAQPGDFVSLKLSGAGPQIIEHLSHSRAPPPLMAEYLTEICELAKVRQVKLQVDAEQDDIQAGIDDWTIEYMKRYNRSGRALMYGTYQAYKKSVPAILAKHLQVACESAFTLGVKLVRGAYLWSDPRWLFWDSIEETHRAYDGIAAALIQQQYNDVLMPCPSARRPQFPAVSLVLAGHNAKSVRNARELQSAQAAAGKPQIELAYAQLMGMAEHISCDLVRMGQENQQVGKDGAADMPKTYQYLAWGSVGECSQYLVRRGEENQDAASRNADAKQALGQELLRRLCSPLQQRPTM